MIVIGFCGLPGSGKTTAIESIKHLGTVINMGDIVRDQARKENIAPTDENLGMIAKRLRKEKGPGILARLCIEIIKTKEDDIFFIDGLRSMLEVAIFRKYWKFPFIAITIDEEKRYEILKNRARSDDPKSQKELRFRDQRELNYGLKEVIENADYRIHNETTKDALKRKTFDLVTKVLKDY